MTDARGFSTQRALEQIEPVESGHHARSVTMTSRVLLLEAREGLFAARGRCDAIALGRQGTR